MAAVSSMCGSSSIAISHLQEEPQGAGAIQPHYVFLTRLSKRDLECGIDIAVGCSDDELKKGS
jgi:hypothetical protein